MRRFLIWAGFTLVVGFLAAGMRAQMAKDLPPGTTSDEVIRAYGWPKGRSATANREIWTFEKFQVILEGDRVVSVTAMPPSKQISKSRNATPGPAAKGRTDVQIAAPARLPIPAPQSKPGAVSPRSTFSNPTPVVRVPSSSSNIPPPAGRVIPPITASRKPVPPPLPGTP